MATLYPNQIDGTTQLPNVSGTFTLDGTVGGADHALVTTNINTAAIAIEQVLGTTAGTNVISAFIAGQTALPIQSGTLGTTIAKGTINNSIFGTPTINGGTANNQMLGTPQINGGTVGSTSVLQPLNSAFWAFAGSNNQILGTNQTTQLSWGSLKYDLLSEFGTGANQFIAKQAGLYYFYTLIEEDGAGATGQILSIRLNGTIQQSSQFSPGGVMGHCFWQGSVPSGGTIDIAILNNSTTNPGTINTGNGIPGFYGHRVF